MSSGEPDIPREGFPQQGSEFVMILARSGFFESFLLMTSC